ncbi:MAG: helix-turn-helix domain-containing protein [Actinomycetota bacterium]
MEKFDQELGERLRAARKRRGWSLHDVERMSGREYKASVLGAYERGERAISVQRLNGLATLYQVAIAHLIPNEQDPAMDKGVNIDLNAMGQADETVSAAIDRFLVAIQMRRRGASGDLTVRQADLELLAALARSDRATVRQVLSDLE